MCKEALDLNAKLISTEQKEYHESLKSGFMDIAERLSVLLGEKVNFKFFSCCLFVNILFELHENVASEISLKQYLTIFSRTFFNLIFRLSTYKRITLPCMYM